MSDRKVEVAFDTAGGQRAGVGHVVRALALAARVRELGARVTTLEPVRLANARRLPVTSDPPHVIAVDRPDTSAALLARRARRWPGARLVALDYYGTPVPGVTTVINLNDARERRHGARPRGHHHGLRFATLRPSFARQRRLGRAVPVQVRRVLVGFGGTDSSGWTGAAVGALQAALPAGVEIHVLSGRPVAPGALAGATVHVGIADPAPLMRASDLAVIGGGTMMIEAACLGLPAIVVPRTIEERGFARQFLRAGAIRLVRADGAFPAAAVRRNAIALLRDRRTRERMHRAGRALVDGRGIDRVARLIVAAARGTV